MNNFGDLLRKSRKSKGMTFKQLALQTGLSIGYLCNIEKGRKQPPKLDKVHKIESVLGIIDSSLVSLANNIKRRTPVGLTQEIKLKPNLVEVLLLAKKDIKHNEIENVVSFLEGQHDFYCDGCEFDQDAGRGFNREFSNSDMPDCCVNKIFC